MYVCDSCKREASSLLPRGKRGFVCVGCLAPNDPYLANVANLDARNAATA